MQVYGNIYLMQLVYANVMNLMYANNFVYAYVVMFYFNCSNRKRRWMMVRKRRIKKFMRRIKKICMCPMMTNMKMRRTLLTVMMTCPRKMFMVLLESMN